MLPTMFGVNWPFGSGEEAKNRFSRWLPWRPSWISDQNNFSYFWSTSHPDDSYRVTSQLAQGCRRSRLLKQLLMPHDGPRMTDDGHWLTTIAHHEHFVLRWANNDDLTLSTLGKVFSRQHTEIFYLFFPDNRIWHFMQIVSNGGKIRKLSSSLSSVEYF